MNNLQGELTDVSAKKEALIRSRPAKLFTLFFGGILRSYPYVL